MSYFSYHRLFVSVSVVSLSLFPSFSVLLVSLSSSFSGDHDHHNCQLAEAKEEVKAAEAQARRICEAPKSGPCIHVRFGWKLRASRVTEQPRRPSVFCLAIFSARSTQKTVPSFMLESGCVVVFFLAPFARPRKRPRGLHCASASGW